MIGEIFEKLGVNLTEDERRELVAWAHANQKSAALLNGVFRDGANEITELSQITINPGTLVKGKIVSPADGVYSIEPTEATFTGTFMNGTGETFGTDSVQVGGVADGVLQWGGTTLGKLIAAGGRVVLDADGVILTNGADLSVNQWMGMGLPSDTTSGAVLAIAIDAANECVYLGGSFLSVGGVLSSYITKYNLRTKEWSSIGGLLNHYVTALAISGDNLFVGGYFTNANGLATADYIVLYTISTGVWSSIGGQLNQFVTALAVSGDNLFVGGYFTDADGNAGADYIVLYTISTGVWSSIGGTLNERVLSLAVSGDNLFVGGYFTDADGNAGADYIVLYTISTGVWSSIGGTLDNFVNVIAISGDNLFAGGAFTGYIEKYTISTDTWSSIGGTLNNEVSALAISGDKLFVGGTFENADSIATADLIALYTISTNTWSSIGGQLSSGDTVYALAILGGRLFVGGSFDTVNGSTSRMIAVYIYTLKDALEQLNRFYVPIRADGSIHYIGSDGLDHVLGVMEVTDNDGVNYRIGSLEMLDLPGRTEPSLAVKYEDNSAGAELVTNGGFETNNFTGWTAVSGTWSTTTASPHTGIYHAHTTTVGEKKQIVEVTSGAILLLKAAMQPTAGTVVMSVQFDLYSGAGGTGTLLTSYVFTPTVVDEWTLSQVVIKASAVSSIVVRIICSVNPAADGVWFDTISIIPNPVSNYIAFEPVLGKVVSPMLDGGNSIGQIPVGTKTLPRVEETRDKLTATPGAAGNVNVGTHYAITTFVDQYGETDADLTQATSIVISASAKTVALTTIPLGKPGTLSRRVYVTAAGATQTDPTAYKLHNGIADNTTTTATYNTADANLSSTTIPTVNTTGSRPIFDRLGAIMGDEMVIANRTIAFDALQRYGFQAYNSSAVNGSVCSGRVWIEAGTYTMYHLAQTVSTCGKTDYYLDGVKIASLIDWYSAATTKNVEKTQAGVVVPTSGYHYLDVVTNGTTGAAYFIYFTKIWFMPAAY